MSSRAPVGATNRDDLFSSRTGEAKENLVNAKPKNSYGDDSPNKRDNDIKEAYGLDAADTDPLQLEHMLGFSGEFRRTLLSLNGDESRYVKRSVLSTSLESFY